MRGSVPGRRVVVASLLALAAVVAVPPRVAGQASLDVPVSAGIRVVAPSIAKPCDLWRTVEEVARFAGVRVGFEHTPDCFLAGRERRASTPFLELDGLTPRMIFDHIVQVRPAFAWRDVDGVVVVRPVAAWSDPGNVLHARVAPFAVARQHPHLVLHRALQSAQPSLFLEHDENGPLSSLDRRVEDPTALGIIDVPITVTFAGGSLLQALNAAAKPLGGNWELGYAGHPSVAVYTPAFDEGSTVIALPAATRRSGHR